MLNSKTCHYYSLHGNFYQLCKSNSYFTLKLQKDEQRVLEVLPQIGFKTNDIYTYKDTNYSELETALTEREVFVIQFYLLFSIFISHFVSYVRKYLAILDVFRFV